MEMLRPYCVVLTTISLLLPSTRAAPATSDGVWVDQGIAYLLMLLALAITYTIHW